MESIVQQEGATNWPKISSLLADRTSKQCRERWFNHLDKNIRKGEWTKEEDAIIIETQKRYGNHWSNIAALLQRRTDNDVKNRFHKLRRTNERLLNLIEVYPMSKSMEYSPTVESLDSKMLQMQRSREYDSDDNVVQCRPLKSSRESLNSSPYSSRDDTEKVAGKNRSEHVEHVEQEILDFLASGMEDLDVSSSAAETNRLK